MSRIGKKPIQLPTGVEVTTDGSRVSVKGLKGELSRVFPSGLDFVITPGVSVSISPHGGPKQLKALWGLSRALLANMVAGVTQGFEKKLELEGVGYRAVVEGDGTLVLTVGFSHPVKIAAPPGIHFSVEKNLITVAGINKEVVGEIAATIRRVKPVEPYKGKGIRYQGEIIRRKAGKRAAVAAK